MTGSGVGDQGSGVREGGERKAHAAIHSMITTTSSSTSLTPDHLIIPHHPPPPPQTNVSNAWIQVLILVPTRELALQTSAVVRELGKHMQVECMVSTGGTSLKVSVEC